MKKLLILVASLLAALPALAGTYTVTTTANEDTRYSRKMTKENTATCATYYLAPSCTESQARAAYCLRTTGGAAPCTGSAAVKVYSGVQDFIDRFTLKDWLRLATSEQDEEDVAAFLLSPATATTAQKNAWCRSIGKENGCLP